MAVRPASAVGRLAVERARAHMPGLSPDSIEVVELLRGKPFVVLRSGYGVVVLDERGRLVRSPSRLAAVASHLRACAHLTEWGREALLPRRLDEAAAGAVVIEHLPPGARGGKPGLALSNLRGRLRELASALDAAHEELRRSLPPTQRTLRRAVEAANDAARADREVARAARAAGASLPESPSTAHGGRPLAVLARWISARLAAHDLPFLYPELSEREDAAAVSAFVAAARRSGS